MNSDNNTDITYKDETLSCTANEYEITYKFDPNSNDYNQTDKVKYYGDFTTPVTEKSKYQITGQTIAQWIFESDKTKSLAAGKTFQYTYTTNITLTAVWTDKTFTVTYDTGDATDCTPADQPCTYGDTNCSASDLPDTCTYDGYFFNGWKCESGCGNSNETINQNDDISKLSGGENMILTAQWEQCPVGYYCEKPAKKIDDCYMTSDKTKICDTAGNCFKWPTTVTQIYYRGGTQQ